MMEKVYSRLFADKVGNFILAAVFMLYFLSLIFVEKSVLFDPYTDKALDYYSAVSVLHTVSWVGFRYVFLLALYFIFSLSVAFDSWQPYSLTKELWRTGVSMLFFVAFAWVFVVFISGVVILLIENNQFAGFSGGIKYLLMLFLSLTGVLSIAFIAMIIAKKPVGAILVFLGYFVAEALLRKYMGTSDGKAELFLPARIFISLIPPPSVHSADLTAVENYRSFYPLPMWLKAGLAAFYVLVLNTLSWIMLNFKIKKS